MNWPEAALKMFREVIYLGCWVAGAYIALRLSRVVIEFLNTWSRWSAIKAQVDIEQIRKETATIVADAENKKG